MRNRFILTPFFLDEASLELEALAQPDWHVNKPVLPHGDKQQRMSALHQPLAQFATKTVRHGDRPVSLAGDCCAPLGILAGLQQAGLNPVLLWLDAHGDFNTWETTPSGFLGGMPLAMLVGRGDQTMAQAVGLHPLPESRVILSDGRDLDPKERQALAQSEVHHVIDARSLPDHPLLTNPVYIHFDVDVINPNDAPAMSYRAAGGPSLADLRGVFRSLAQTKQIVAVSMTTWTPQLDGDGRSRAASMELLRLLVGQ
jgi:arginase